MSASGEWMAAKKTTKKPTKKKAAAKSPSRAAAKKKAAPNAAPRTRARPVAKKARGASGAEPDDTTPAAARATRAGAKRAAEAKPAAATKTRARRSAAPTAATPDARPAAAETPARPSKRARAGAPRAARPRRDAAPIPETDRDPDSPLEPDALDTFDAFDAFDASDEIDPELARAADAVADDEGDEDEEAVDEDAPAAGDPAAAPQPAVVAKGRRAAGARRRATPGIDATPAAEPLAPPRTLAEAGLRLGIEQLHAEQERAIEGALEGRDVLVVMPTGFGKSACYQAPSLLLPKPVVLVSPLLALLRDQHEKLIKRQVPCVRLDGTVRGKARREAYDRVRKGGPLLVMTTPETLGSEDMAAAVRQSGVSLAAVDEAHCISEWGHDFRPAYLRLGERLRELGAPPVLALTATATEHVREGVVRALGMRDPLVIASSPHRSNLAFEVLHCEETQRLRALVRLVQRLRRPGLVYCSTTKAVDEVHLLLRRFGIPAHRYHGRMGAADRKKEQDGWMKRGRRSVMVATSAFGLGIDKPDVRYVVHAQAPASLEQYVQEAGRAGRDGRRSNCLLLFGESDRAIHEALFSQSRLRPDQLYRIGRALAAWAHEDRPADLEALALAAEMGPRIAQALLVPIEEAGIVRLEDDVVRIAVPAETVESEVRALAGRFQTLRTEDGHRLDAVSAYAATKECRAVHLRRYFGEEGGTPCEMCDHCRERPERSDDFFSPVSVPQRMREEKERRERERLRQEARLRRGRGRGGRRDRGGRGGPEIGREARAPGPPLEPRSAGAPGDPGVAGDRGGRRRRGRGRRRGQGGPGFAAPGAAGRFGGPPRAPGGPPGSAHPPERFGRSPEGFQIYDPGVHGGVLGASGLRPERPEGARRWEPRGAAGGRDHPGEAGREGGGGPQAWDPDAPGGRRRRRGGRRRRGRRGRGTARFGDSEGPGPAGGGGGAPGGPPSTPPEA